MKKEVNRKCMVIKGDLVVLGRQHMESLIPTRCPTAVMFRVPHGRCPSYRVWGGEYVFDFGKDLALAIWKASSMSGYCLEKKNLQQKYGLSSAYRGGLG